MTFLPLLADRVLGRPLLLTEDKIETILAVLGGRIGIAELDAAIDPASPSASRFAGRKADSGPYRITDKGLALIPIIGSLVNRGAYIGAESGLTSYEGISEQLKKAQKDGAVRGIVLDLDTPGGEAAGCFELARQIREIRKAKPVYAVVNDMACSAGYALASACNKIFVSETSIVGSIGVVWVHFDRSKAMETAGIRPTIIHAGKRKADGNSYGKLPDDVRERMQSELDTMRDMFVAAVVAGRPNLKPKAVRDTEAGCFMGSDGVDAGLADAVLPFDKALDEIGLALTGARQAPAGFKTAPAGASTAAKEAPTMSTEPAAAPAAAPAAPDAHQLSAARAEGAAAERTRIASILGLPEAKDRTALAIELAVTPNISADDARRLLAAQPASPASAAKEFYGAVAASGGSPGVRAAESGDPALGPTNLATARERANIERQTKLLTRA